MKVPSFVSYVTMGRLIQISLVMCFFTDFGVQGGPLLHQDVDFNASADILVHRTLPFTREFLFNFL